VERRYVLVGAIGQHPVNDRFLVGLAFCDSLDVVRQFGYCLGKLHKLFRSCLCLGLHMYAPFAS
jgi:hypothetical protein